LIDYFCVCINSKIYRRFGSREYERRKCWTYIWWEISHFWI
jgi:hypothetical protein